MCGETRVFHPRDEWTRRRHAWYSSLRLIGLGMRVHVIGGLIMYNILGAEGRIILSAQKGFVSWRGKVESSILRVIGIIARIGKLADRLSLLEELSRVIVIPINRKLLKCG